MKASQSSIGRSGSVFTFNLARAAAALLLLASLAALRADNQNRAPEAPEAIRVPAGNTPHAHVYAAGVQIYVWNGASWAFQFPAAVLFADAGMNGVVGIHYAGPTWESNSGSMVVGAAVTNAPSSNPNSIPQLLLRAVSASGPGLLASTTYIQRVNTIGGRAPANPGTTVGEEARVPYTAEYFFYRAH